MSMWDQIPKQADRISEVFDQYVEYKSLKTGAPLDGDTSVQIQSTNLDVFHDFSRGYVALKVRLMDVANSAVNSETTAPLNVALATTTLEENAWSLFSRVEYSRNGDLVEHVDQPAYVSQIHNLTQMTSDYILKQGGGFFYYPEIERGQDVLADVDAGDVGTAANIATVINDRLEKSTFNKRLARTLTAAGTANRPTKFVYIWLPLNTVLGSLVEHRAVRGFSHKFDFTRNTNNTKRFLHGTAGTAENVLKVFLDEMSIWVPQVKADDSTRAAIEMQLKSGAQGLWSFPNMTTFQLRNVLNTSTSPTWRISTPNQRLMRVYIMFQLESRLTGALNGGSAHQYDSTAIPVESIELRLDGKSYPQELIRVDWANDHYHRLYYEFLRAHGMDEAYDSDEAISFETFKEHYPIYVFDLRKVEDSVYENVSSHDLELRATTGAIAGNYAITAVVESERQLILKADGGTLGQRQK